MTLNYRELVYAEYRKGLWSRHGPEVELELRRPYIRRVFGRLVPLNPKSRVLDLGSGCGIIPRILSEMGVVDVQGVDRSQECVAIAKELGVNVCQSDLVAFLQQAGSQKWDIILAFDVLEHLTKDEVVEVLHLIGEHLAPEGLLVMHLPNGESVFGVRVFSNDITHETNFTRNSLHQLLTPLGYEGIRCFEDTPVVHGLNSAIRSLGWRLVRMVAMIPLVLETGSFGPYIFTQTMLVTARRKHGADVPHFS